MHASETSPGVAPYLVAGLLAKGADVNMQNGQATALVYATRKNNIDVVRQLLEAGARPDVATINGTPLNIANQKVYTELAKLLTDAKIRANAKTERSLVHV